MRLGQKHLLLGVFLIACVLATSCSSRLGWGVLLWATEEPPIPSGTVLPVYIRSNIDKVWVVGVPEVYRGGKGGATKIEVPISRLTLAGSRGRANRLADSFAEYALVYAENLQDGLPVRDTPDNSARRVYRLRAGEIVKILSLEKGSPAISTTGTPLPGEWYRVLTEDGSTGYCFSYRLRLFDHGGGQLAVSVPSVSESVEDPDLDVLMSRIWSPESYSTMINYRRIDLDSLSRHWRFDPGQETGIARIYTSGVDRSFEYTAIRPDGRRAWRFEGTNLLMQLRADTTLAVQFSDGGAMRTLLFVSLPISVDDLIMQESARRERLYGAIYSQGPVFTSNNYGTIVFEENGSFVWRGFDLLVPQHLGENVEGSGTVLMDLFLSSDLEDRYNGAFTMRFTNQGSGRQVLATLRCMYLLDNQGFRIEIAPDSSIDDVTVTRRAASPMVLYFFRDTGLW